MTFVNQTAAACHQRPRFLARLRTQQAADDQDRRPGVSNGDWTDATETGGPQPSAFALDPDGVHRDQDGE
jgi:hypothetical protein